MYKKKIKLTSISCLLVLSITAGGFFYTTSKSKASASCNSNSCSNNTTCANSANTLNSNMRNVGYCNIDSDVEHPEMYSHIVLSSLNASGDTDGTITSNNNKIACNGNCISNDSLNAIKNQVSTLKENAKKYGNDDLKVLASLGGDKNSQSQKIYDATSTSEGSSNLAESLKSIVSDCGLDGIDFDWDFSCNSCGDGTGSCANSNSHSKSNYSNYSDFSSCSDSGSCSDFDSYSDFGSCSDSGSCSGSGTGNIDFNEACSRFKTLATTLRSLLGDNKEISMASQGDLFENDDIIDTISQVLDFISVLSSNYSSNSTGSSDAGSQIMSLIEQFLNKGVSSDKICMGIPFYGTLFSSEDNSTGNYNSNEKAEVAYNVLQGEEEASAGTGNYNCSGNSEFSSFFKNAIKGLQGLGKSKGGTKYYNESEPYIENDDDDCICFFDNEKSIEKKSNEAIDNNLGGMMCWQIDGDTKDCDLQKAVVNSLNKNCSKGGTANYSENSSCSKKSNNSNPLSFLGDLFK